MVSESKAPVYFYGFVCTVIVWSFVTTVLAPSTYRYLPITVMGASLSLLVYYSLDARSQSMSIDGRYFKQATLHFYMTTLHSAIKNKQKWRDELRKTKNFAQSQDEVVSKRVGGAR